MQPVIGTHLPVTLPTTNSEGKPIVPMTDEQKYIFDLKGWLCIPALISEDEIKPIRAHLLRVLNEWDAIPLHERHIYGGPVQALLDHPVIVGVLNEILANVSMATEDCYGFRFDGSFVTTRKAGQDNWSPHGGHGVFAFCGNSHLYQAAPGRVFAGLTRVVWEINGVGPGDGGTLLLSGSHKAAYSRPPSTDDRNSPFWETYTCPPGSVLIFTESLCHTGTLWTNTQRDRLAMFTCYNTVGSKWHPGAPSPEVLATMPPKRQTLFRGVWNGMGKPPELNTYYDEHNRAV